KKSYHSIVVPIALAKAIVSIDIGFFSVWDVCIVSSPSSLFVYFLARSSQRQRQQCTCLSAARCAATVFPAQAGSPRTQFPIAAGEPVLVKLDVVLEPGAHMAAEFEAPAIDFKLVARDAGGRPG